MTEQISELKGALRVLARCHTTDDSLVGFTVDPHPNMGPWATLDEYVTAWRIVRSSLGLPAYPPSEPQSDRGMRVPGGAHGAGPK